MNQSHVWIIATVKEQRLDVAVPFKHLNLMNSISSPPQPHTNIADFVRRVDLIAARITLPFAVKVLSTSRKRSYKSMTLIWLNCLG